MVVDQRNGEILEHDEIDEIGRPNRWLSTKIINAATELHSKKGYLKNVKIVGVIDKIVR